jgi:opacity protein-like surface antigen
MALAPAPAAAQGGGPGFSFREPRGTLTLRAGLADITDGGELFDFATSNLRLHRSDFRGMSYGAELAIGQPGSRIDGFVSLGLSTSSAQSEYRDWIGDDDLPIRQSTSFRRVPVSMGVKAYLAPRGRALGRFAWVPSRVAPYVGAGVGAMYYRFAQEGEFVDFETGDIFQSRFQTKGWGPMGLGMAGVDYSLAPMVAVTADVRYQYAKADVGGSFDGFDKVDLSGFTTTLGITFRF